MESGIVFSIEEFSTENGPGVRTTVFLKGCPMRCTWCHSPEGQTFSPQMLRSPNGCLQCGACLEKGKEQTGKAQLVKESAAVCPRHLIRESGERFESQDLVKKLLKNSDFFKLTEGGITFSGGEPLAQSAFLIECLELLEGKANRAIQTSGYCDPNLFSAVLGHCDFVLFDLKIFDRQLHQQYCGCDNGWILANYTRLAASGLPFITRIPLIPTVTDTEENICNIISFMLKNGVRKVELLPYHKLSGSKYPMTGRKYSPNFDESVTPSPHIELFEKNRIEVKVL